MVTKGVGINGILSSEGAGRVGERLVRKACKVDFTWLIVDLIQVVTIAMNVYLKIFI